MTNLYSKDSKQAKAYAETEKATDLSGISPDIFVAATFYAAGIEWDTEKSIEINADIDSDEEGDGPDAATKKKSALSGFAAAYVEQISEDKGWNLDLEFSASLQGSQEKERDAL